MEIIESLEPTRRNLYGGTVGYLDAAGDMDMAIAIRTAVLHQGKAYVQAGAGLVADSDPASEQRECENKAAAVLRAVAIAATLRPDATTGRHAGAPPRASGGWPCLLCLVGSALVLLAVVRAWVAYRLAAAHAAALPAGRSGRDAPRPGGALALVGLAGSRDPRDAAAGSGAGRRACVAAPVSGWSHRRAASAVADPTAAMRRLALLVDAHGRRHRIGLGGWPVASRRSAAC